ncbi:Arc family DNA-binding protein [Candidatus Sulfidibacterium hydrothermale]|uniref:Arc family DNA-binding protein n=1 Tax=Candidatus Sulfidibacterium hydrothermale TaxID=2875962 RepID=UPI001F0B47EC|nr:Arc family DNA-binding protein [Candidatus Sulfidibacterium hydrothermale]UBM63230.1 Arc family DNA-binding protein [Candidatus Sulfidibacterium hydrothermale]
MTKKKKPFVLRLQPEMMKAIEKWAADDFRSINGQIEWILSESLKKAGRWKKPPSGQEKNDKD